jgi:putative transposase
MARENPLWGAERIRGELLKLGIKVAKRTIQKYMRAVLARSPSGQSWSTFLTAHGQDIWACDFVPVVTIYFKTLYAFVIVHLGSRRVVHVTDHPSDAWVAQQLREATPFGDTPKHLICDNDKKYGPEFDRVGKTCGIDVIHTPYQASLAKSICERFIGSLRRECLDHVLVLGMRQLVRVLIAYVDYFNRSRPHTGTPLHLRPGQVCAPVQMSRHCATDTGVTPVTRADRHYRSYRHIPDVLRRACPPHCWQSHRLPCVERPPSYVCLGNLALIPADQAGSQYKKAVIGN